MSLQGPFPGRSQIPLISSTLTGILWVRGDSILRWQGTDFGATLGCSVRDKLDIQAIDHVFAQSVSEHPSQAAADDVLAMQFDALLQ